MMPLDYIRKALAAGFEMRAFPPDRHGFYTVQAVREGEVMGSAASVDLEGAYAIAHEEAALACEVRRIAVQHALAEEEMAVS